jgi:hypothetical protein
MASGSAEASIGVLSFVGAAAICSRRDLGTKVRLDDLGTKVRLEDLALANYWVSTAGRPINRVQEEQRNQEPGGAHDHQDHPDGVDAEPGRWNVYGKSQYRPDGDQQQWSA